MQVYIENLIISNGVMYLTFLLLIKKLFKFEINKLKLFLASLVGGMSSYFFTLNYLTKFEISFFQIILIVFISSFAYKNLTKKKLMISSISLIVISNIFNSILNTCQKFSTKNNTIIFLQLPLIMSLILIIVSSIILKIILDIILTKFKQTENLVETELEYGNKKIRTIGLVDTGNNLYYDNSPVSFINFDVFSSLTGLTLTEFLDKKYTFNDSNFVEVNSLAGTKKLFMIKLKKIKLKINNNYKIINNPQVAVSLKLVKKDYKMILNHNIL